MILHTADPDNHTRAEVRRSLELVVVVVVDVEDEGISASRRCRPHDDHLSIVKRTNDAAHWGCSGMFTTPRNASMEMPHAPRSFLPSRPIAVRPMQPTSSARWVEVPRRIDRNFRRRGRAAGNRETTTDRWGEEETVVFLQNERRCHGAAAVSERGLLSTGIFKTEREN